MALTSAVCKVQANGNGSATVFSFSPMRIFSSSDLVVTKRTSAGVETTLTEGTGTSNYSVSVSSYPGTGSITYPASGSGRLATGESITIERVIPLTQTTDLESQGVYSADNIEAALDRIVAQVQQIDAVQDRSLRVPTSDSNPTVTLPTSTERASQLLGFDASGNPIAAQPSSATISSTMQPFAAAASLQTARRLLGVDYVSRATATTLTIPAAVLLVRTGGYYSDGDGGGALYERVGSAPTWNEYFQDASGAYFEYVPEGEIWIEQFGAKPADLTFDNKTVIEKAINYAAGRTIRAGVGQFRMNSGITYTGIVNLLGVGNGCGPGPAAISNAGCTQFLAYFSSGTMFNITSNYPCTFADFQINVAVANRPQSTGAQGIAVSGPVGSVNMNSQFINVGFTQVDTPIRLTRCNKSTIDRCYFDSWGLAGVKCDTTSGIEGNLGQVAHCMFFGPAGSATQGPAIYTECGYGIVHANLFTGGAGAVSLNANNYPAGSLKVFGNHIEDHRLYGVNVSSADGSAISMVQISDNEFSNVSYGGSHIAQILIQDYSSGTDYLDDVIISGNVIRSNLSGTSAFINVASGENVMIKNNTLTSLGTVGYAIICNGTAVKVPAAVMDNHILGTFTTKYDLKNTVVLRDMTTTIAYADRPTCGNGSVFYCSDGRNTNFATGDLTLRAGGTGAHAWRMSGQWLTINP